MFKSSKLHKSIYIALISTLFCLLTTTCREEEIVVPPEYQPLDPALNPKGETAGFYVLNEGNMGSNKASLDYFDFTTGIYARNIYGDRNPNVVKELGDVGNDMQIYGSKLYIVVNCSHKIEVLDVRTAVRIGQVDIPNCRYIKFFQGKAYVSSFVGPVEVKDNCPRGEVYEIDTISLNVTRRVVVGYQPEEMEIIGKELYVANSGGYRPPEYDNTISVINLESFKETRRIRVGVNPFRIRRDKYNRLWVTTRGNRADMPSRLYLLCRDDYSQNMQVSDSLQIGCSNLAMKGDSIYLIASQWDDLPAANRVNYAILDIRSRKLICNNFITDGTDLIIKRPYGLCIHPETGEILLSDAKNYVSSGTLYCFSPEGTKLWSARTGDIPTAITFLRK